MFDKLVAITHGLNRRFPHGNDPFQIMTRLLEESGELAQMINHFEGTGIKREKYGTPDKRKLAKEVMDVLRCGLQVAIYYGIETELDTKIKESYEALRADGLVVETIPPDDSDPGESVGSNT